MELKKTGYDAAVFQGIIVVSKIKYLKGDIKGAIEDLRNIKKDALKDKNNYFIDRISAKEALFQLKNGDKEKPFYYIYHKLPIKKDNLTFEYDEINLIIGRILIYNEKIEEGLLIVDSILNRPDSLRHRTRQIEIYSIKSIAYYYSYLKDKNKDNIQKVIYNLEKAFHIASQDSFIRVFLDEGSLMKNILQMSISYSNYKEYIHQLLAYFELDEKRKQILSDREQEIMKMIASGATNQVISNALYISLNTVKVHMNHILSKLEVRNRTEAVKKARELGIID